MNNALLVPVSVKGIIFDDKKIWLRHNERNEWELPGGKLDIGEQPEEAIVREMREELGFKVQIADIVQANLYVIKASHDESRGVVVISYLCKLQQKIGKFEFRGEAGLAKFEKFTLDEIKNINMPDFYKSAILKAFKINNISTL
jgi:mutator protein MutT